MGDKKMNWFYKFMYGRYGSDQLNMTLIVSSLILSFLGGLFQRRSDKKRDRREKTGAGKH